MWRKQDLIPVPVLLSACQCTAQMLHNNGTALQALLHSYSCLDFASILDVTQLRVHKLRKLMKDRVQNRCSLLLL